MKKALIISSILVIVLCLGLFGCGSDGNTITPSPSPTVSTYGSLEGAVVDQDSNKIPGAFIVGNPYSTTSSQITTYAFTQTADELGNYEIDEIYPGTYEVWGWPTQAQFGEEPDNPLFKFLVTITAGQSTNQILRYGQYFIENPTEGYGNIKGKAFENGSTAAGTYCIAYRIFEQNGIEVKVYFYLGELHNLATHELVENQTNFYPAEAGSQGIYEIKNVPVGPVGLDVWKSIADHEENYLNPKASYKFDVVDSYTIWQDVQYGNMGEGSN